MAVAHDQIEQVYQVLFRYLSIRQISDLCTMLQYTDAYAINRSFKDTIDRLNTRNEKEKSYGKKGKGK